jgi:hypothetical protein
MYRGKAISILMFCLVVWAVLGGPVHGQSPASVTLTGILEMGDGGPELRSGNEMYLLDGGEMSDLVGKQVTVTGVFDESPDGPTVFIVESIKE